VRALPAAIPHPFPTEVRRVLFVRPGGIGDAVLLVPTIQSLRRAFPDAVVEVLAERRNFEVFQLCSEVKRTWCYDLPGDLFEVLRGRYDFVIDTEQWHRLSAVMTRLIRSSVKIGFSTNDRKRLFSHDVPYSQDRYEVDGFLNLLEPLDVSQAGGSEVPFLFIDPSIRRRARELLGDSRTLPLVAIFPGASIRERRWDVEKFRAVAEALAKEGIGIVVVGGQEDAEAGSKIVNGGMGLNLAGRTSLVETAAVLARSNLLISGDSGVLHIAIGLGIPTVSLFGPGRPEKWAPRGARHIVLRKKLPCSPCTTFGYTPSCPVAVRCMREIAPDEVLSAATRLLERFPMEPLS